MLGNLLAGLIFAGNQGFHLFNIFIGQSIGLEIGQAPPGFTVAGQMANTIAVGVYGLLLSADRLEHMSQAQHCTRMFWLQFNDPLIGLNGFIRLGCE